MDNLLLTRYHHIGECCGSLWSLASFRPSYSASYKPQVPQDLVGKEHMDIEVTPSGIYTTPYGCRKEVTGGWLL